MRIDQMNRRTDIAGCSAQAAETACGDGPREYFWFYFASAGG